jgi:hypothetical protein
MNNLDHLSESLKPIFVVKISGADPNPDPPDQRVFGPPGSGFGSTSQRYGSGSGSIIQRHGSADPDPPQNVMDLQHCLKYLNYLMQIRIRYRKKSDPGFGIEKIRIRYPG